MKKPKNSDLIRSGDVAAMKAAGMQVVSVPSEGVPLLVSKLMPPYPHAAVCENHNNPMPCEACEVCVSDDPKNCPGDCRS